MISKMGDSFINKLISLYADLAGCRKCGLPVAYTPQLRPPGKFYKPGGIVFAQINPGHIGRLSDDEIQRRYKRKNAGRLALRKREDTEAVLVAQKSFLQDPSVPNYRKMRDYHLFNKSDRSIR